MLFKVHYDIILDLILCAIITRIDRTELAHIKPFERIKVACVFHYVKVGDSHFSIFKSNYLGEGIDKSQIFVLPVVTWVEVLGHWKV